MAETDLTQTKDKYILSKRYTGGGRQKNEASALTINLGRKSHFLYKTMELVDNN